MAADIDFGPVDVTELDEVRSFLQTVFGTPENWKPFTREVMLWKCFAPHPLWEGNRSYVLRYRGEIVAHGSLVPVEFVTEAGLVPSACIIDWAASKKLPGSGGLVYQNIQRLTGTLISIGGSENARTVLPRMGFKRRAELASYARVARPWKLYSETARTWKDAARLGRNVLLTARSGVKVSDGWRARRVDRFDDSVPLPDPAIRHKVVCRRSPELLNYFLACPAASVTGYVLLQDAKPIGYFVLSRTGLECRIAEVWVNSAQDIDWRSAYALALQFAAIDPGVSKVVAAASAPHARAAIEAAGLRHIDDQDLSMRDPKDQLGSNAAIAMSLLENDAFYLD